MAGIDDIFANAWGNEIQDPETRIDHLHVEIFEDNNGLQCLPKRTNPEDISTLCAQPPRPDARWALRVLITPRAFNRHWRLGYVPYAAPVIEALCANWSIPRFCFHQSGFCAMAFSPVPGDHTWKGFMFRSAFTLPFPVTLILTHNTTTNTTNIVCYSSSPSVLEVFPARLLAARAFAFQPYLCPILIINLLVMNILDFSLNTREHFLTVRETMGTNLYFATVDRDNGPSLAEMPRRLTALANATASVPTCVSALGDMIDCLDLQLDLCEQRRGNGEDVATIAKLKDQLELMRQYLKDTKRRNDYLRESVQAQVQMVYALLAQKDNELNHRYGADMRIIAAVTLVFLPGTFVATLFSASFWDFSPNNNGSVVSKWVWLYWVITGLLTAGVLGIWRGLPVIRARWRNRKVMDEKDGEKKIT